MIINQDITIYHKILDTTTRLEEYRGFYYKNCWVFSNKNSKTDNGYKKVNDIEIRIPYVPEYNSDQIEKIAILLSELKHITKIRVLPYHNYAGSKYAALNIPNTLPSRLPTDAEIKSAAETIKSITSFVVLY